MSDQLRFTGLFTVALYILSPSAIYAVSIGDFTLRSNLGEPLHAQGDLRLEKGETVETKCLSLSKVENEEGYLPPGLKVVFNQSLQRIEIKSSKQFNEPFAIFNLNIKCLGMGTVSKRITLLPNLGANSAETALDDENSSLSAEIPPNAESIPEHNVIQTPELNQSAIASDLPSRKDKAMRRHTKEKLVKRKIQFRLKLSDIQLDLSHNAEKSSDGIRKPEQQKLLDEDEQTAQYMSARNKLEIMQKEVELLKQKLKLAELKENTAGKPSPANNQPWLFGLMLLGWLTTVALILYILYQRYSGRNQYDSYTDSMEPNSLKKGASREKDLSRSEADSEIDKELFHQT